MGSMVQVMVFTLNISILKNGTAKIKENINQMLRVNVPLEPDEWILL